MGFVVDRHFLTPLFNPASIVAQPPISPRQRWITDPPRTTYQSPMPLCTAPLSGVLL